MKKILNKISNYVKSTDFIAGLWSIGILLAIMLPFALIFIAITKQYSYVTPQFWIFTPVFVIILILDFVFANFMYEVLVNKYKGCELSKDEYIKIFVNELLGPFGLGIFIIATTIYLDQLSKHYAVTNFVIGRYDTFIKGLINFTLAYNKGAAWSILYGHQTALGFLSLGAGVVMLFFMKDFNIKKNTITSVCLTLMVGGTFGNMIDRFFSSQGVVDFIDLAFMNYPTFNLADSFLVVGTLLLMAKILLFDVLNIKKDKKQVASTQDDSLTQELPQEMEGEQND